MKEFLTEDEDEVKEPPIKKKIGKLTKMTNE